MCRPNNCSGQEGSNGLSDDNVFQKTNLSQEITNVQNTEGIAILKDLDHCVNEASDILANKAGTEVTLDTGNLGLDLNEVGSAYQRYSVSLNMPHVSSEYSEKATSDNTSSKKKRERKTMLKPGKTATHRDRHFVVHNYHDHANEAPNNDGEMNAQRAYRGGVSMTFPLKLHEKLDMIENDGYASVISWQSHGRCFVVHKPKEFANDVLPRYFGLAKVTSFQRQLNLYGFTRLTRGKDRGGYYHELFLRGKPFLSRSMIRTKTKGTLFKAASSPDSEPNFYSMPPVGVVPITSTSPDERSKHDLVPQEVFNELFEIPQHKTSAPTCGLTIKGSHGAQELIDTENRGNLGGDVCHIEPIPVEIHHCNVERGQLSTSEPVSCTDSDWLTFAFGTDAGVVNDAPVVKSEDFFLPCPCTSTNENMTTANENATNVCSPHDDPFDKFLKTTMEIDDDATLASYLELLAD